MILTIDLGNSNIVSVLYDHEGKRIKDDRQMTIKEESYSKYREFLKDLLEDFGSPELEAVTTSCVVPYLRACLRSVVKDLLPEAKHYQVQRDMVPELEVHLKEPRELGSDLIATCYGALGKFDQPTIIADLGSATKLTIVKQPEVFLGGVIMPGISFQAKSLHQMIPHLPRMEVAKPEKIIGHDTMECIQSGIVNGTLAAIIQLAEEIEIEIDSQCSWVITGGLAKLFNEKDLGRYHYDEFLLSDGLYYLSRRWLDEKI